MIAESVPWVLVWAAQYFATVSKEGLPELGWVESGWGDGVGWGIAFIYELPWLRQRGVGWGMAHGKPKMVPG